MHVDVVVKLLLSSGAMWLVLDLARRCGARAAGWTAGLPIATALTLVMLGLEHGDASVAEAAKGALLAVVGAGLFAVVYLRIAMRIDRWCRAVSLSGALAAVVAISGVLAAAAAAGRLGVAPAIGIALLACAAATVGLRVPDAPGGGGAGVGGNAGLSPVFVALLVGLVGTALSTFGESLSPTVCGLIAGAPTTCAVLLLRQHRVNGRDGAKRLLQGYVRGLGARTAFLAVVAFAGELGWVFAMVLGLAACIAWGTFRVRSARSILRAIVAASLVTAATTASPQDAPRWATVPVVPALPVADRTVFVDHDGARLWAAVFNRYGGSPVVLLHGGFASSDSWGFEVPLLARTHEVIVVDARGHGRSTMPASPLHYADMAADVVAVMDALGIAKASFVGSSDGGIVALILGFHDPRRVDKLFVWGASFDTHAERSGPPDPAMKGMGAVFMERMQAQYRAVSPTPERFAALRAALTDLGEREPDLAPGQLARIRAATVIADGEHEQFVDPAHTKALAALIPGAVVLTMPDVSHGGPQQDPLAFHAAVEGLLDADGRSGASTRSRPVDANEESGT